SLKTDVKFAGEENLLTEVSIDGGKEYLGPFPSEEKVEGVDTNKSALAVSGGGGGRVPRWWVEGALLAGTEPLAETTTTVAPFKLLLTQEKDSVEIGTVECSEVKLHGAQIEAPSGRSEKDVEYAGCKVLEPHSAVENAKCEVQDRAIVTNELQATLEGPLKHEKLEFKPKAGKELGSFFIIGAGCSFAGEFKADGDMVCGYPKVEEEKVEHVLEFTGTSGSDVTLAGPDGIGTNPTDGVTVTYEDHLASHKLYSAF
ncbi:MAG TPA: hypothetical protein VMF09_06265, partial [Solirubrobacteraceae bacterium]|nr:hypothetical protein [Solirubrobacteraceae bacterium]